MSESSRPHAPRRVTLKAVAEAARVSPITVSNVVNGRFDSMSAKTRERVEEAIAALDYRVNIAARGLRRSRHYCVALIVADERSTFLAQPAHHQVAAGLSNVLGASGYALAIEGVKPTDIELSSLHRLSTDALCLLASGRAADHQRMLQKLQRSGQPVVVFHDLPGGQEDPRTCHVRSDDRGGGRLLAEHLHARGARRFLLLLSRTEWIPMSERAAGVKAFCRARAGTSLEVVRADSITVPAVQQALQAHLAGAGMPDAVIGGNDLLAAAAQKFFSSRGVQVPEALKIAGFGGYDFLQFLDKRLTSVRIPSYEMGEAAGREILAALEEGSFAASDLKLPVRLLEGEST